MFVRFRHVGRRLQASLIETRRVGGKVRHEHVAMLRSIPWPATVADRVAFWPALHERLARLQNRFGHDDLGKLIGQVAVKIPMVTPGEQRALQKENAEADERIWSALADLHAATAVEHKAFGAKTLDVAKAGEASAADAAAEARRAKERLAKIERGDDVAGGLGKPKDIDAVMRAAGFTKRDFRRMQPLESMGGEEFEAFSRHMRDRLGDHLDRFTEREARAFLKRLRN